MSPVKSIHEIRAELRAGGEATAEPSGMRSAIVTTLGAILAVCAGAWVVHLLFLKPAPAPMRPSAAIPTFQQVQRNIESGASTQPSSAPSREESPTNYAGKSVAEMAKAADGVCFARAHARHPSWSKTPRLATKDLDDFDKTTMPHFNELMRCLLTEAPMRYCAASQRRMISAEVVMYFRGIERFHKNVATLRSDAAARGVDAEMLQPLYNVQFEADQGVVAAIEMRLRDGVLTAAERDRIAAAAPDSLRLRFTSIKPPKSPCPEQPWWAFWR